MAYVAVVTGATGFVGTELVKQLLERGWTVRATVRDASDAKRVEPLLRLAAALPGAVHLYEADLLREGSFHAACKGADFVFHCASPFVIDVADPVRQLIEPAVTGTRNVMLACAAAGPPLQRVVVTSSVAAVKGIVAAPPLNGRLYTEDDWNETSTVATEAYWVSKTRAEHVAWDLAREHGLSLVTILPNFVMGPALSAALPDPTSVGFLKGWLEGNASTGSITFAPDVRDVARAHVLAATTPSASGRYIVSDTTSASPAFIAYTLQERFPEYDIPHGVDEEPQTTIDNSKATRELGLHLTPLATTLVDMAVTLVALGIATPRLRKPPAAAAEALDKAAAA